MNTKKINQLIENYTQEDVTISCPTHGQSKIKASLWKGKHISKPKCEKCEKEKMIKENQLKTFRENHLKNQGLLESINKFPLLRKFNFESYNEDMYPEAKHTYDQMKNYANNFEKMIDNAVNVIMYGGVGTGKTFFGISLIKEAVVQGYSAKYQTTYDLFNEIKKSFSDSSFCYEKVKKYLIDCDILCLDEIGVTYGTEFEINILFEIINQRYMLCKPTIIITNLDIQNLTKAIGIRSLDRLMETCLNIKFDYPSLRRKPKKLK